MDLNPLRWCSEFKDVLRTTKIEIVLGLALGLAVGLNISYKKENERASMIPLGFSEISQIERDAEVMGREVGHMTRLLTSTNDAAMKVFECWNLAHESTFNVAHRFASELEYKMDSSFKIHHYELNIFLEALPGQAKNALDELKEFTGVRNEFSSVNSSFGSAWDDIHIDHYHEECTTRTECAGYDSDGSCESYQTVQDCHPVYDYTTHTYTYHKQEGEEASARLDIALKGHPELVFKERILTASKTNADGEDAAESSRKVKGRRIMLKAEEYLGIANTWYTGSTLSRNLPVIYGNWKQLHTDTDDWRKAKETAHSDSYITYSPQDDGPKEFQIAERTLEHGQNLSNSIGEIASGIEYVKSNSLLLENKVKEFISIELDRKEGNSKKLMQEIMAVSKQMYTLNFKAGFEVDRFRWLIVLGGGLLGAVAGSIAGLGIDYIGNRLWFKKEN